MAKMHVEFEHTFPQALKEPQWNALIASVKEYVEGVRKLERQDEDSEHYIFEHAVTAIYGEGVWDALNERVDWGE